MLDQPGFHPKRLVRRFLYSTWLGSKLFGVLKPLIVRRVTVMLAVTYRCVCKCKHCGVQGVRNRIEDEMDTAEMLSLLDQLSKARTRIGSVYLFGGEPLMRPDLMDVIRRSKDYGFKVMVDTNGAFLDEAMADRLAEARVDRLRVSVDSAIPEHHDANRGMPGLYDKALRGARLARARGVWTELSTFCTPEKIESGEVADLKRVARENGLNGVRIMSTICSGALANVRPLSKESQRKLSEMLEPGFAYYETPAIDTPNYKFRCFSMLKGYFFISPYGDVQPCCFVPMTFGNLRHEPLQDILDRMWQHPLFASGADTCPMNRLETHEWIKTLPTEGDPRQGPLHNQMHA